MDAHDSSITAALDEMGAAAERIYTLGRHFERDRLAKRLSELMLGLQRLIETLSDDAGVPDATGGEPADNTLSSTPAPPGPTHRVESAVHLAWSQNPSPVTITQILDIVNNEPYPALVELQIRTALKGLVKRKRIDRPSRGQYTPNSLRPVAGHRDAGPNAVRGPTEEAMMS